jgi:hypothetical protein
MILKLRIPKKKKRGDRVGLYIKIEGLRVEKITIVILINLEVIEILRKEVRSRENIETIRKMSLISNLNKCK